MLIHVFIARCRFLSGPQFHSVFSRCNFLFWIRVSFTGMTPQPVSQMITVSDMWPIRPRDHGKAAEDTPRYVGSNWIMKYAVMLCRFHNSSAAASTVVWESNGKIGSSVYLHVTWKASVVIWSLVFFFVFLWLAAVESCFTVKLGHCKERRESISLKSSDSSY